jgi:hypothetical protein
VAAKIALYEDEWRKRGCEVKKCALLLPLGAPDLRPGLFGPKWNVGREGIKMLGGNIGLPEFEYAAALKYLVTDTREMLGQVAELRAPDHRRNFMSFKMGASCIARRGDYYVSVNPPAAYWDVILQFDTLIRNHGMDDLQLHDMTQPQTCCARTERANSLIEQPRRRSGASVTRTPLEVVAPAAFMASIIQASSSPAFNAIKASLLPFCKFVHDIAMRQVGGLGALSDNKALAARLPPKPDDLVSGPFVPSLLLSKTKKVQGTITRHVMELKLAALDENNSVCAYLANRETNPQRSLTAHDAVGYHVLRHKSKASAIFSDIVPGQKGNMEGKHFVTWFRMMLLLPPLHRPVAEGLELNPVDEEGLVACKRCSRGARLDTSGVHALGCESNSRNSKQKHDELVDQLSATFEEIIPWVRMKHEPSAPFLMAQHFTEEECSLLFHGSSTKKTREMAAGLRHLILACRDMATGTDAHSAAITAKADAALALRNTLDARRATSSGRAVAPGAASRNKTRGVRPDIAIWINGVVPREWWIDVTIRHDAGLKQAEKYIITLAKHLAEPELNNGRLLLQQEQVAPSEVTPRSGMSPALKAAERGKTAHFNPLLSAATNEFEAGRRAAAPKLIPFEVSSRGEMGENAMRLINDVADSAAAKAIARGQPADGIEANKRRAKIRARLIAESMVTNARGVGRLLSDAGGVDWRFAT